MDILEMVRNTKNDDIDVVDEIGRTDNLISALSYYLANSVFKRLLKQYIFNVTEDGQAILDQSTAFYITFERVKNSEISELCGKLGLSLIDSAIGLSTF
jgi:predicted subunit of tRNA(5-methylaminomethyl-2-thiouridylate) methyltransferase